MGADAPPLWTTLFFVAMLLAVALGPAVAPHWWESNRHRLLVSLVLGLPVVALYRVRRPAAVVHALEEYAAFVILLAGLLVDEVVGVPHAVLAGISLGAVCLGANTYIGNAPNFMVRAIAVEAKFAMPGFFGYMAYSTTILIPLYAAMAWLFL